MKVDQFESVFRSAAKDPFQYEKLEFRRILVVTDQEADAAAPFLEDVKGLLLEVGSESEWNTLGNEDYSSVESLLVAVKEAQPDLVVTYRNLRSDAWKWPYILGEYLDALIQIAEPPVLVVPHPEAGRASGHAMQDTDVVMAMTDHLTSDHRLVNVAARLTSANGKLFLAHVEDEQTFERYMETISKIDTIDTEAAEEAIRQQLLKEPSDYITSCTRILAEQQLPLEVESHVGMGHHLDEYRLLLDEHEVDLLVMNTKDEDQLAMHGIAYPLAVQLRRVPLLLL